MRVVPALAAAGVPGTRAHTHAHTSARALSPEIVVVGSAAFAVVVKRPPRAKYAVCVTANGQVWIKVSLERERGELNFILSFVSDEGTSLCRARWDKVKETDEERDGLGELFSGANEAKTRTTAHGGRKNEREAIACASKVTPPPITLPARAKHL